MDLLASGGLSFSLSLSFLNIYTVIKSSLIISSDRSSWARGINLEEVTLQIAIFKLVCQSQNHSSFFDWRGLKFRASAGGFLGLELLYWALVIRLVKQVVHLLLGLVCLLQSAQELSLFLLQHFGMILRLICIFLLLLDTHLITVFQVFAVHVYHLDEVGFGPNLVLLDSLESFLFFFEIENAVLGDDFINVVLLIFNFIVSTTIRLKRAFHVLHDPGLGV